MPFDILIGFLLFLLLPPSHGSSSEIKNCWKQAGFSRCNPHTWGGWAITHNFCFPPPLQEGHHYSSQKFSPLQCCPGSRVVCYSLSSVSKLTSLLIHWGDRISPLAGYTFINSLLPIGICPVLRSPIFFFFLIKPSLGWGWSRFTESLGSTALTKFLFSFGCFCGLGTS